MKKVCLDAGHGGSDPGAVNPGLGYKEKDLALKVVLQAKQMLENSGVKVILTRDADYRLAEDLGLDLSTRAKISNDNGCDAFVSVHLNSAASNEAHGMEVYSFNGANTPELSQAIHKSLVNAGLYSADRGTKVANFAVLRETYCIAALVEMAFINNNNDCMMVVNNIQKYAEAIARGILSYLGVAWKGTATSTNTEPEKHQVISDMPIIGKQYLDAHTLANYLVKINNNPKINCSVAELAEMFLEEGEKEGVRGDIAFCQACKETGYFKFGGQVLPEQNNYAGIGATNNSAVGKGAWFKTPREGVKAQIQHLKGYASTEPLVGECVDPRYTILKDSGLLGTKTTWKSLGGSWAYPGYDKNKYSNIQEAINAECDYGSTILKIYMSMRANYKPENVDVHPAMDNTPDGWADEAVKWAVDNKILVGDEKGNLHLHDNVTRQELVTILHRTKDK